MQVSTFATLVNSGIVVPSSSADYFAVDKHFLTSCLGAQVRAIHLDEGWYLERYPDVAEAIASGAVADVRGHYTRYGYWENRMPYRILVDEPWYMQAYPDVAAAVAEQAFASGQEHFDLVGYQEGRFPHPNFELRTNGPASGGREAQARPAMHAHFA
jgi:hypothetical protein